jgi:hypothetical protein
MRGPLYMGCRLGRSGSGNALAADNVRLDSVNMYKTRFLILYVLQQRIL